MWRDQAGRGVVSTPCNTTTAAWGGNHFNYLCFIIAFTLTNMPEVLIAWHGKLFQTRQLSGVGKRDNDKKAVDLHWHEMRAEPSPFYSQFIIIYLQREWTLFLLDQTQCGPEGSFIYLCNDYFGGVNIWFLLKCKTYFSFTSFLNKAFSEMVFLYLEIAFIKHSLTFSWVGRTISFFGNEFLIK